MTNDEKEVLLLTVADACRSHPELGPRIVDATCHGIQAVIHDVKTRAYDMEMSLALALGNHFDKHNAGLIHSWILKHKDTLAVPFDHYIENCKRSSMPRPRALGGFCGID